MFARHFMESSILVVWFVTISALPSVAQGVGAIGGTVMDATGAVLPGATVTLSAAQGTIGSNQETFTDGRGVYQFLRLVPGRYVVRAQLQGFRPAEQPNIVVNADTTARADLQLEIGALEEAVLVKGGAPLLDTTTVLKQTILSREELEALPNRTDVWSMARVIPSIVVGKIDVGGTERFLSSSLTVRGSTIENKYYIDSMDVAGPSGTGATSLLYFVPYVYEESSFQVAANSAEHAIGGLTVNMVTRTGTNQLRGGAVTTYTPPAWARSRNYSPELREQLLANVPPRVRAANPDIQPHADLRRMRDVGAWLGGPIVRDKLWFVGTWSDQRMDRYKLGNYDRDGKPVIDDNIMWTTTAKVSWQATKNAQLSYFHNLQYKLVGHRAGGVFADDRARQYSTKYPTVNQVKFTSPIGSRIAVDVGYSRMWADDVFGQRPEVKAGDVATFDTTTQVSGVALPVYSVTFTRKHQIKGSFSWLGGKHDVKVGYEFMRVLRGNKEWTTSGMRALFANGVPTGVNTYLTQVELSTEGNNPKSVGRLYDWIEDTNGLYIQEKWTPLRKLVLNAGLRYETSNSWEPKACRPDTVFFPGACFDRVDAPSFGNFAPRFNMVYDVTGDGRTALKFAANRYDQQLGVSIVTRLSPVTQVSDQRQWVGQSRCGDAGVLGCDRNGDLIPQLNEIGPSPGYVFTGVRASYADGLKRPVSNEFSIELQRELPQSIVASVGYVYRRTRRNIGERNLAVPASAWIGPITVTEVTSGQTVQVWNRPSSASSSLFYNSDEFNTDYKGVDITLNKRMGNRWSMMGGATFGAVRSATAGGNRNDPNIINSPADKNRLTAGDRPWSVRMSGVYELPYRVFVSGTWQLQAGAPEETTVLVASQTIRLAQGNQAVIVAPVGDVRYPNVAQLDLNIRKVWSLGGRKTIAPRLQIFNVTNSATIDAWVTQLGPTYHRPSNLQRGRLINMDVSLEF